MLDEFSHTCPYCGEPLDLLVDTSGGSQAYIENCAACCRPFEVSLEVGPDGQINGISLKRDDE